MKNHNIPKLRYPEFTDAWEKCKLGKSFKIKRGLTYKPENIVTNGGIRVLRSSNIDEDTFQLKDDDVFVSRESINIDFVENLDILITSANGSSRLVGKHAIIQHIDNEMVHGGFMLLGKSKEPFFINALLSAPWYEKFINKNVSGGNGAIGNLKAKDLENAVISLPTLPEQQKIGNLFKQLDRLITLHKRKWDDVILLKKALLQKMFPKNGSDFPEIRFPEFTDAWEKCKLGKSFKIKRGLTYKPENIVTNGGIRVLRSSNIDEDTFQLKDDDVFVSRESINIDFVENLDILITSANGSSRLVGKHAIIQHIDNEMVHGGFMLLGKSKEPFFINALLSAPWYEKFINKNVSGGNGAIGNLKAKDLENAVISLPTLPEQQKIGNLFKQLDRLITLHKRQHEHYQLLKKALLQQMFV